MSRRQIGISLRALAAIAAGLLLLSPAAEPSASGQRGGEGARPTPAVAQSATRALAFEQSMALEHPVDPGGHVVREGPRLRHHPDPEQPQGLDIALEDKDGLSMASFHAALRRAEAGEGQARVLFYGASHVASDLFTGYIRRELQGRFGDAGHGFVLPVHPWRRYRHFGVEVRSNREEWTPTRIRANSREVDYLGLAGVTVETEAAGAYGIVRTAETGSIGRTAELFELYYLRQPGGGDFDVLLDGEVVERVRTASAEAAPGYATYRVPDDPHALEIRTVGNGKVRLFGVVVERNHPGVVVDTLGINGSRARYQLLWDDALYREHLARRDPDLVVLAYGTNEAGDNVPIEVYEQRLHDVIARIQETTPRASCLLIGPSDRPVRLGRQRGRRARGRARYEDRPRTGLLVEAQHRVATDMGCAFFDLVAFSGGPMSMVEWSSAEPPFGQPDHIHYTMRGYRRLGEVLLGALMEGFDDGMRELPESADPQRGSSRPPSRTAS